MPPQASGYLTQPAFATVNFEQNFETVIRFLRRRWVYILGSTLLVGLIGALAVLQATPKYTAVASVAVEDQKPQVVNVQDVVGSASVGEEAMATQGAIIRSTSLIGKLIDKMQLVRDPEFSAEARAKDKAGFSLFSPSTWFDRAPPPAKQLSPQERAQRRAALMRSVQNAILVEPGNKSYVITISVTSVDPMKATAMANTLSDLYIQDGIEAKFEASRRASEYLRGRVEELRGEAVSTDRAAEMYRASSGLTGTSAGNTVDTQQLSELNSQLIIARSERAGKEAQLAQIRALTNGNAGDIETSGVVIGNSLIQRLREQESTVQRNLANLQATYGENHPKIINANAELRDLRAKIVDEVRKLAASTANEVAIARARENSLAGGVGSIEGRVNRGGAASVRLRELEREAEANRAVYETFLNRLKETNQQVDIQSADSRIVSPAVLPLRPSEPRVGLAIMASLLAGLMLGTLLALAIEKLDNTIRGSETLEAMGGGATLAHLPIVAGDYEKPENIVFERPQSMVTEALRTLRSALALSDVDNPPKVVMLTSSVPAEGKTFVSAGLARVAAQAGLKTIVIDADMRHPRVHLALSVEKGPGLIQVLSGQTPLEDAIRQDPSTDLHVLTAGTGTVNPPDLLRSENMQRLLLTLRQQYDLVILDTPPFVPMTDSQVLASLVDKLILVVRWGHTPVPVVRNVIKQIHRLEAPLVGSVLSRVHFSRQAQYGFGDYGYHYSRYGAYYGTQD